MVLSFERKKIVGAFMFAEMGATLLHLIGLASAVPPESKTMCKRTIEIPQELGRSRCLLGNIPAGDTGLPTPGLGGALVPRGAKATSATEVPPSEGNEVRRDGRQEVIAP
jgi:hypothetical protein